ncbi:MAG: hypothetical protein AB2L21_01820 [Anaerolineaceae bacterium]
MEGIWMDTQTLKGVVEALSGANPMAYAIRANGSLVVVDRQGRKKVFTLAEYQHLLKSGNGGAKKQSGRAV